MIQKHFTPGDYDRDYCGPGPSLEREEDIEEDIRDDYGVMDDEEREAEDED